MKSLKKKLYQKKFRLLWADGEEKGFILPFEKEMYKALEDVVYAGTTPANMYLVHLKPIHPPMKCYDRSEVISMAFKDCHLVRGKLKLLELESGPDKAGHGWVEKGGWVYDPTYMMKFKRSLYYEMFGVSDVQKIHRNELEKDEYYQRCLAGHIERLWLIMTIPILEERAAKEKNTKMMNELEIFKKKVNYDYKAIQNELFSMPAEVLAKTKPPKLL